MKNLSQTMNTFIGKSLTRLRLLNQVFYGLLFFLGGALIIAWMFLGLVSLSDFIFRLIKINLLLFCLSEATLFGFFGILKYWETTKNLSAIKKINQLTVKDYYNRRLFNGKDTLTINYHPQKENFWQVYLHPLEEAATSSFGERRLHIEIIRKIMGLGECFLIAKIIYFIEHGDNFFVLLVFFGATLLLVLIKGFFSSAEIKRDF